MSRTTCVALMLWLCRSYPRADIPDSVLSDMCRLADGSAGVSRTTSIDGRSRRFLHKCQKLQKGCEALASGTGKGTLWSWYAWSVPDLDHDIPYTHLAAHRSQ